MEFAAVEEGHRMEWLVIIGQVIRMAMWGRGLQWSGFSPRMKTFSKKTFFQ